MQDIEDIEEFIKKVPLTPPEGMKGWLFTLPREEYIIYKSAWTTDYVTGEKEKAIKCVCTACERDFIMPYARAGCSMYGGRIGFYKEGEIITTYDTCKCPYCGENVTAVHTNCLQQPCRSVKSVISVHNIEGIAVIIRWKGRYIVYKSGKTDYEIVPDEACAIGKKKWFRLCSWTSCVYSQKLKAGHWVARKRCEDTIKDISNTHIFPFDIKVLEGTAMENSKLDIYLKSAEIVYPVSYLRLYQIHNNVENLITIGLGYIINDKINRCCINGSYYSQYCGRAGSVRNIKSIDFKKSKPHEMLGLAKDELKTAIGDKWSEKTFTYYKRLKPFNAIYKDVGWYADVIPIGDEEEFIRFSDNFEKLDFHKTASYLMKQSIKYEADGADWRMLYDYWNMCIQLNYDSCNADIRYPQRLKRSHDQAAEQITYNRNKEKDEDFKKRYNSLSRFSYVDDELELEIHPARSPYEMRNEGEKLHHCVASYIDSHATGMKTIFFIRHRNQPTTPYFTLEFNFKDMKVVQNRGLRNCERTDEVKKFEDRWVLFVKEIIAEEKKNGKCITTARY